MCICKEQKRPVISSVFAGRNVKMSEKEEKTGEIVLYQPEGTVSVVILSASKGSEVRIDDETVWLTQAQMAELFGVKENTITYHIQEIFNTDELEQIPTTRKI